MRALSNSRIWRPYTQEKTAEASLKVARAEGAYLYTDSGKKIFDGVSSWWLINHGHCHPEIVEAVRRQAGQIDQVLFANFTHEPAEELAELLVEMTPEPLTRVFLSDNGSTAVEIALKMALQACAQSGRAEKTKFIAFEGAYHGDTVGAMSVSGKSPFTKPYRRTLFDVLRAKHPLSSSASIDEYTEDFERLLANQHQDVAGVIIEPLIQGAAGMIFWPDAAVKRVAELCREHDVLLIFDEVMTGFGRTGHVFAMDRLGVAPDLLCLSKGLTGGTLPLAATLATEDIYEAVLDDTKTKMFFHGHSFTGNPISCAAAVASLKIIKRDVSVEKLAVIENAHRASLKKLAANLPISNARVCGTIGAFDLRSEEAGYLNDIPAKITAAALEKGLFARPLGTTVYLMPPYRANRAEIEECWSILNEVLQ